MATNPMMQEATQKMEESSGERHARKEQKFSEVESSLPKGSKWNLSIVDKLTSYLGQSNPLASEAKAPGDSVWLLDNTAYRPVHVYPHREQPWQAEFVAAYFERNSGIDASKAVADIAEKIGLNDMAIANEEGEKRIAERLVPFLNCIKPAKYVNVVFPSQYGEKLGPGGRNAISAQIVTPLGEHEDGDVMETKTATDALTPHGPMLTHFASPEGWTVISDIDDTIKVTMTPSPIGILRSTFVSDPTPIEGMPPLYTHIKGLLNPNWFYLSASPYNLYTFLRPFIHSHYPHGTIILRDASWMNIPGILTSLTQGTQAYKVSRMDKIHQWLPKRKVLCIGDSTQSDPEAYGEVYRKYKGWVKGIFIRRVEDVQGMEEKNKAERFEKAFEGVPRGVWRVFEKPEELKAAVEGLRTI